MIGTQACHTLKRQLVHQCMLFIGLIFAHINAEGLDREAAEFQNSVAGNQDEASVQAAQEAFAARQAEFQDGLGSGDEGPDETTGSGSSTNAISNGSSDSDSGSDAKSEDGETNDGTASDGTANDEIEDGGDSSDGSDGDADIIDGSDEDSSAHILAISMAHIVTLFV